ncbi:MAG: peptide-methionine (R)-S-oxide reductase MsrB [Acidimicrobiia bacterium]|nr:peptide-methionine (R)-S-oxide reductase MsrB [Acidimicrobiia bacterium]
MGAVPLNDFEWRARLSAEQYEVLRCSATEAPFTGAYWATKDAGTYHCAGCGTVLFRSEAKYDSGTGWPSFWEPVAAGVVETVEDLSHGMRRLEVRCTACGGHLGHVFPDGPQPTGLRYCMNSAALDLERDRGEPAPG